MYYIVIIDDDLSVQRELKLLLENAGYRADVAEDFANIPEYVQKLQPDLLLLDVALPGADGITLCSKIRMISDVPIIFITSQSSSSAELECMMTGGDDFIEKPYRPAVLLAHIAAILRRVSGKSQNKVLVFGGIELNLLNGTVRCEKKEVELSKNEMHILSYFFMHKDAYPLLTRTYTPQNTKFVLSRPCMLLSREGRESITEKIYLVFKQQYQ